MKRGDGRVLVLRVTPRGRVGSEWVFDVPRINGGSQEKAKQTKIKEGEGQSHFL